MQDIFSQNLLAATPQSQTEPHEAKEWLWYHFRDDIELQLPNQTSLGDVQVAGQPTCVHSLIFERNQTVFLSFQI